MPSIGQTWVLASIGTVVEMGVLSTLKLLLMESRFSDAGGILSQKITLINFLGNFCVPRLVTEVAISP
jgi:hypothetical protein